MQHHNAMKTPCPGGTTQLAFHPIASLARLIDSVIDTILLLVAYHLITS